MKTLTAMQRLEEKIFAICRSREMFFLPSYPVIHHLTHEICFVTPILGTTVLNDLYDKACGCFRLLLIYL